MLLSHRIRINATADQCDYFARAAGTARWLRTIHRDAHAQPFANLARAFTRYFAAIKERQPAYPPRFKKKGRCRDSFYVANDKFRIEGRTAVLPKIGAVLLCEALRWPGKVMGASVSREAGHWFLAVQVEVLEQAARRRRTGDGIVGIDLGLSAAVTLDNGCGVKNASLALGERAWTCTCGARHDRDVNAAINLKRLATGALVAAKALPEASHAAMPGTAAGMVPAAGGKVTPARHEHGQQDGSGQEENSAHMRARF